MHKEQKVIIATVDGFDAYMNTGEEVYLDNLSPADIKIGDEFVVAGEGWNWKVKAIQ